MKKIMIVACAIAFAAAAQAASVDWGLGTVYGVGEGGKGYSADAFTGNASVQFIIGASLSGGVIGDTVYNQTQVLAFDSGYAFPEGLSDLSMTADQPYYAQIVLTSGDSKLASGVFEITASSLDGNYVSTWWGTSAEMVGVADATTGSLSGLGTFDETYGAFGSAGWQDVPEPTSGLLLLLGVAGLALRRKRA